MLAFDLLKQACASGGVTMTRLQKTFLVWLFLSISTFDAYLFTTLNFQRQRVHLGHAAQPWQECSLLMLMTPCNGDM
jgi:hypothetical protein